MNRGELWWYELPDTGHRPGCIVTRQAAIGVLNAVLLAPATRTVRGIPTEVRLGPEDGMPTECALSLDNLLPVPKTLLTAHHPSRGSQAGRALRGSERRRRLLTI